MKWWVDSVSKVIAAIKADDVSPKLKNEFYEKSTHSLDTRVHHGRNGPAGSRSSWGVTTIQENGPELVAS
jgi:hypothetical protein